MSVYILSVIDAETHEPRVVATYESGTMALDAARTLVPGVPKRYTRVSVSEAPAPGAQGFVIWKYTSEGLKTDMRYTVVSESGEILGWFITLDAACRERNYLASKTGVSGIRVGDFDGKPVTR